MASAQQDRVPPLGAADWLQAWELGETLAPALRPCAYLAPLLSVDRQQGLAQAEQLSIGRRDAHLIDLHAALFGPRLQATAQCPACAGWIEFELDAATLRLPGAEVPAVGAGDAAMPVLACSHGGQQFALRLPDSRDLAAAAHCGSPEAARDALLRRCVLDAGSAAGASETDDNDNANANASTDTDTDTDRDVDAADDALLAWSPDAVAALSQALADADPQAATELDLGCPACGHRWIDDFDIGSFLADALGHWAQRTLDQVHALASAYGWSEAEILAMAPARRARYLARVLS